MLTKIAGNTITHRWPLNIEHVHEISDEQFDLEAGDFAGLWDLAAPADGYCWVLSSITVGFDVQTVLPSVLFVDSDAGGTLWWSTYVGQTPAPLVGVPTAQGPFKFHFVPAIKFPVNEDVAINWIGGDPAVLFFISWEVWQEQESISP